MFYHYSIIRLLNTLMTMTKNVLFIFNMYYINLVWIIFCKIRALTYTTYQTLRIEQYV